MIHIQKWSGQPSARITDMTNAGKRGKTCRVFHWSGRRFHGGENEMQAAASKSSLQVEVTFDKLTPDMDYDTAVAQIMAVANAQEIKPNENHYITTDTSTIQSIRAPREKLIAGIAGIWSGSADEDGISLGDLTDQCNEPREITPHDQSKAQAYILAAKVWEQVKLAKDMHEASDILRAAGCKLHYYCAMD